MVWIKQIIIFQINNGSNNFIPIKEAYLLSNLQTPIYFQILFSGIISKSVNNEPLA